MIRSFPFIGAGQGLAEKQESWFSQAMVERLSLSDASLFSSHAEFIQQYEFASQYCAGKRVLDAGCANGYGSHFLARQGAASVLGVDISQEAINEAEQHYRHLSVRYRQMDIQRMDDLNEPFDVVVNIGTLPHLRDPNQFLSCISRALLVTSTPNGDGIACDADGRPLYRYHQHILRIADFKSLLDRHFDQVSLFGQWLTYDGRLRKLRARQAFEQLCDLYYSPINRVTRFLKRSFGKKLAAPPTFFGAADSFSGDHLIAKINDPPFPWPAATFLAVCSN